jgi:SOS-response transcriptional repressor LexA
MAKSFLAAVFAANVKRLLVELGKSQADLASHMEVSPPIVSRMLSGKHPPTQKTQDAVADFLGVEVEDLFVEANSPLAFPVRATAGAGPGKDDIPEGETLDLGRLVKAAKETVVVRGDSMAAVGLHDGDVVMVRGGEKAKSGDIVVAWIHELQGCVVKQLYVKGNRRYLNPRGVDQSEQTVILMTDEDRIEGVCMFSIHPLEADLLTGKPRKL